jgi:hypothetical protein
MNFNADEAEFAKKNVLDNLAKLKSQIIFLFIAAGRISMLDRIGEQSTC